MKYALTLTLSQKYYELEPEQQLIKMSQIIDEFRDYQKSIVVELTKQQNVHSHGTIEIEGPKDLKQFWNIIRKCKLLPKGSYAVCLKTIENETGWIEYLKKDLETTKQILNASPWLTDDFQYQYAIFKLSKDGTLYWEEPTKPQ